MAKRVPAEYFAPGVFLAEMLQARGLTEFDLANDTVGLTLARIHGIIYHDHMFNEDEAKVIAAYVGMSTEWLLNTQTVHFDGLFRELEASRG